jgi:uncharacterized Zn finger protein
MAMQPLVSFIELEQIRDLASRSNFRYGKEMANDAKITITDQNHFNRVARIEHGNSKPQMVSLMSTAKGFRWKCTCSARKDFFCSHCVAVALYDTISAQ